MQNSMLLTPSSPVLSRPLGLVKCLLAAVLVGLLDSGSAVADASDYLPLAVGNSWRYAHRYREYEKDRSQWTNYMAQFDTLGTPQFTISVLHTEVIDGHTYFVISDIPDFWPPVPSYFIAGKKLRWAGNQLMERTADGERSLFRFGGTSGASGASGDVSSYAITIPEGLNQATRWGGRFNFDLDNDDDDGVGGASDSGSFLDPGSWDRLYEQGGAVFLRGFGIEDCGFESGSGDAPLFINYQTAKHAVINGRTVTVKQAREEAAGRASSSDSTSIEWLSWGAIKQEASP